MDKHIHLLNQYHIWFLKTYDTNIINPILTKNTIKLRCTGNFVMWDWIRHNLNSNGYDFKFNVIGT